MKLASVSEEIANMARRKIIITTNNWPDPVVFLAQVREGRGIGSAC